MYYTLVCMEQFDIVMEYIKISFNRFSTKVSFGVNAAQQRRVESMQTHRIMFGYQSSTAWTS